MESLVQADKLHFRFHNEDMLHRESGFEEHDERDIVKRVWESLDPVSREHTRPTHSLDKFTRRNINSEVN